MVDLSVPYRVSASRSLPQPAALFIAVVMFTLLNRYNTIKRNRFLWVSLTALSLLYLPRKRDYNNAHQAHYFPRHILQSTSRAFAAEDIERVSNTPESLSFCI